MHLHAEYPMSSNEIYRIQNPFYITVPAIIHDSAVIGNLKEVYMRRSSKAYLNGMGVAELKGTPEDGWTFLGNMAEIWKQGFVKSYNTMGVEVHMVKIAIEGIVIRYSSVEFPSKPESMQLIDTATGMIPINI